MARAFCGSMSRLPARFAFAAAATATALVIAAAPASARGPEAVADVAEQVIDAVVNISTSQNVNPRRGPTPQVPPGSPFEEFFEEFFKNRRGQGDGSPGQPGPRRVSSLGSGFIIDASGVVVTNKWQVDGAATEELRARMRRARGPVTWIFDRGDGLRA